MMIHHFRYDKNHLEEKAIPALLDSRLCVFGASLLMTKCVCEQWGCTNIGFRVFVQFFICNSSGFSMKRKKTMLVTEVLDLTHRKGSSIYKVTHYTLTTRNSPITRHVIGVSTR